MLNVVLLGTGNLARHLFAAISKSDRAKIVQVVGRNLNDLAWFSHHTAVSNDFNDVFDANIYLIAVKDDAIAQVSKCLANKPGVVAHTSGATDMDVLIPENKGVFYPLQSFTKGRELNFKNIPICIEAKEESSLQVLKELANSISDNVQEIDSEQRKKLHLAAVFVSNFTNYLYGVGKEICVEEGLSFDLLKPLILETAEKVQTFAPRDAQTGPARRKDRLSMQNHLKLLKNEKHIALYQLLSDAIKEVYEEKL
ncbi:Rossmann-like and DUF2520 domain-containing protein [Allomuricauda sp. M10]|uniref:Rossmann-like and DUF2520 domain-containing protein n=1 Tax=Allomuricauda sp. M10 TaxID=2683292 RepID=UPI001D1958D2|nr:DUF2520 domain-containing protein [Muricauda sp. M10]